MFDKKFEETQGSTMEAAVKCQFQSGTGLALINLVPRETAEVNSTSSPFRGSNHFDSFERASQQEGLSPAAGRLQRAVNRSSLMNTRVLRQQEEPALSEEDGEVFATPRGESPSLLGGNPQSALGFPLMAGEPLPNN